MESPNPSSDIELVELSPVRLSSQDHEMQSAETNTPGYISLDWRSSEEPSKVMALELLDLVKVTSNLFGLF